MSLENAKWAYKLSEQWQVLSGQDGYRVLYMQAERFGAYEWRSAGRINADDTLLRYISLSIMQRDHDYDWSVELRVAAEDDRGFGRRPVAGEKHIDPDQLPGWLMAWWPSAVAHASEMQKTELTGTHLPQRQLATSETSSE